MRMPPFRVLSPKSLDEALMMSRELSESGEEFDWVAGGTDLLPNYKWHINVKGHRYLAFFYSRVARNKRGKYWRYGQYQ